MVELRLAINFYENPQFGQQRQRQKYDHKGDEYEYEDEGENKGDQLPSRTGHTKSAEVLEKMKGHYTVQEFSRMPYGAK